MSQRLYTQVAADKFMIGSLGDGRLLPRYAGQAPSRSAPSSAKSGNWPGTLREIAKGGPNVFYNGPIAQVDIAAKVNSHANPGSPSTADLKGYRAKERVPVCTDYKRWKVCGMPPPSSGGIAIAQILAHAGSSSRNATSRYALASLKPQPVNTPARVEAAPLAVHAISEATTASAYADRGLYVADADPGAGRTMASAVARTWPSVPR